MDLDTLTGALKAAQRDTSAKISPGLARRLACEAGLVPAVLGTRSEVLDVGRRTRFHTGPMRTALALRDHGCTADGCDRPPGLCHAHHDTPGPKAAPPTPTPAASSAPDTTPEPTTRHSPPPSSPAARSPSPDAPEHRPPPQADDPTATTSAKIQGSGATHPAPGRPGAGSAGQIAGRRRTPDR
jgi:hypothetical protein